jgi:hypothetical protein
MAAMKPRTGDGPLEVTKEGRGIVMRVPLEGGGRLVVELNADEARALGDALKDVVGRGDGRDRDRGDLTRATGGQRGLEGREEVDAERVGRLVGARPEQGSVVARQDRERPDLGPADLVRERGAERELGR